MPEWTDIDIDALPLGRGGEHEASLPGVSRANGAHQAALFEARR